MSISDPSRDKRDSAVKHAPSAYFKLVHAEEAEIFSWAINAVVSDISDLGTLDSAAMRHNLRERTNILLMLFKRLMDGWKRTSGHGERVEEWPLPEKPK